MRLVEASFEPLRLTLRRPLKTAQSTYTSRVGFLVRLEDEEGNEGWGEAMPLPEFGTESAKACEQGLQAQLEVLGHEWMVDSVERLSVVLGPAWWEASEGARAVSPVALLPAARHAVELALLDLLARRRRVPLCRLLTEAPRPEVELNALLGAEGPEALAEEGSRAVGEGYRTLKVKVGGRPLEEDEARLEALRRAVEPQVRLRVDANGAWRVEEALRALERLGRFGLELCEQPVPAERLEDLRALYRRVPCAVAADEALGVAGAARALVEEGPAVDVLVLKPMVLGGVLPALRLARRAHARGVESYVTSSLDGVVARAGAAHLAAALPSSRHASGLGVGHLFVEEPVAHPYRPERGRIQLPGKPGLGWP